MPFSEKEAVDIALARLKFNLGKGADAREVECFLDEHPGPFPAVREKVVARYVAEN